MSFLFEAGGAFEFDKLEMRFKFQKLSFGDFL